MPPKRKNDAGDEKPSERKKQKLAFARTIAVQPVNTVSSTQNASTSTLHEGLHRLPSAIDVERFAEARSFEIDAMQTAIKNASGSSTSRAWQALPRHLRRRAASHDVRRVPTRLRDKARTEMDPVRKKILGRSMPKRGKAKRLSRSELFLKRQRDKLWLESHLWHAKRMKMENMWGYRLAVHPTEKAFRPSHRASLHGSILHDASYHSLIELKGPERILRTILEACCDPQVQGPGAKRYTTGSRALETHIYKPGSYPFDLIAPISVIWKPLTCISSSTEDCSTGKAQAPKNRSQKNAAKQRRKGKGKEMDSAQPDCEATRVVWLRSHPSVFNEVFSSLQAAASSVLDAAKRSMGEEEKDIDVQLSDLRGQINVFEIMGPKSSQVLKGALNPVPQDHRTEFTQFWKALTDVQTTGSIPRGMIVGFKVNDPRLKFPPKNAKPKPSDSDHAAATITTFPSATLAQSEIWDDTTRNALLTPRYKKKDLDERRSKNLVPGTPLKPLRQDDRIPVLLIQRSLECSASESQSIHGWTLIIPAGWSMAFFSSLIFTGTRVGGQRERQTQAFEAGTAYFPRDYPSSSGYDIYATAREQEERARWERKPPAKRPNFEKLETRSPWKADWHVVLGLQSTDAGEEGFVTTQREEPVIEVQEGMKPWLLRGSEVSSILSNVSKLFNHAAGLLQEINRLRLKRSHDPLDGSIKAEQLLKAALVSVRVTMCKRGAPDDLALIYSMADDEVKKWEKALQKARNIRVALDEETVEEVELSGIKPPSSSIVGYVTTGHFSLSQGEGFAIGALTVVRLLELQEQSHRLYPNATCKTPPLMVKVRNGNTQQCRAAYVEILNT
ncbi:POP1-domain-containing protein [Tricholoma matsutake]|nr:POP1-domain-containing protein [Tricholoma matsutake 945]